MKPCTVGSSWSALIGMGGADQRQCQPGGGAAGYLTSQTTPNLGGGWGERLGAGPARGRSRP